MVKENQLSSGSNVLYDYVKVFYTTKSLFLKLVIVISEKRREKYDLCVIWMSSFVLSALRTFTAGKVTSLVNKNRDSAKLISFHSHHVFTCQG